MAYKRPNDALWNGSLFKDGNVFFASGGIHQLKIYFAMLLS